MSFFPELLDMGITMNESKQNYFYLTWESPTEDKDKGRTSLELQNEMVGGMRT